MSRHAIPTGHHGRSFLLGGAALAAALATGAHAEPATAIAAGREPIANQQANQDAPATALGSHPIIGVELATTTGSAIDVSANSVVATARGNQARTTLAPQALDLDSVLGFTGVAGPDSAQARYGAVIANAQSNADSPVGAAAVGSRLSIDTSALTGSTATVDDNDQEAVALGNDAINTISPTGGVVASAAGVVNVQVTDDGSPVRALFAGQAAIGGGAIAGSTAALTNNLQRAIGYGNSVDNGLSVRGVSLAAPTPAAGPSTVSEGGVDATVAASFGLLSSQTLGGSVFAGAAGRNLAGDPAAAFTVSGTALDDSRVINEGNGLIAAGYGNRSANSLDLDGPSITRGGYGDGAIANVTNVQRIDDADVVAAVAGGAAIQVDGSIRGSFASSSDNAIQSVATGNLAEGNLLTVRATSLDASGGQDGGEVGTALLDWDGALTVSAPFSVQNAQDSGWGAIVAKQVGTGASVTAAAVSGSSLQANGNLFSAAATANDATNGLELIATTLDTSADLNSLQSVQGDVLARLGASHDPTGVVIDASPIDDSRLTVSGNSTTGTAIGNSAASNLTVSANFVANGGGHTSSQAGALDDGMGAAANFALANAQRVEQPGEEGPGAPVRIASRISGRFATLADGPANNASLAVDGNSQQARALANTAVNRLGLTATTIDGDEGPAAGTALSSSQIANADVEARSKLTLGTTGQLDGSSASLTDNRNTALAVINDVDNGLTVEATQIGAVRGLQAVLNADWDGGVHAVADHVLANSQIASGSVMASAVTRTATGPAGDIDDSSLTIDGNATAVEASANRATNALVLNAAAPSTATAGVANVQSSDANVTALAVTRVGLGGGQLDHASLTVDGDSTTALARGNAADNNLTFTGGARSGLQSSYVAQAQAADDTPAASAGVAVLNAQTNGGGVSAVATAGPSGGGYGLQSASLKVTDNPVSATAYGNVATNQVAIASLGRLPTAAVTNQQTNYGPVTARVINVSYVAGSGSSAFSTTGVAGNHLAATATGNQAITTIASPR